MTLSNSFLVLFMITALTLDFYLPYLLDLLQEHLKTPLIRELIVCLVRLVINTCHENLTIDPRGLWAEAASKGWFISSETTFQH